MFTPIGFFAPQGGGGSVITDGLQIYADPNLSTVSYTTSPSAGTISNLASTGYNITFGNVTATPYDSSAISFTVGTSGTKKYFLPNGSNPYGNDSDSDQGFVNMANAFTTEAWFYFPTSTASPYYYNFEGNVMMVYQKFPSTSPQSFLLTGFRRWSDSTNRYKYYETLIRNDVPQYGGSGAYPLGNTQWNDGQWHLWSVTSAGAGGSMKTYVDGVDQNISATVPAGPYGSTTLSYYGGSGGGDYRVFQGGARGGAFRWYNKELTAAEVLNNYNVESGTYGT